MIKDCRLVSGTLTQSNIERILAKVPKNDAGWLEYQHFTEALAAIACLRNPDPYVPLKAKITIFISLDLIDPLIRGQLIKNPLKR